MIQEIFDKLRTLQDILSAKYALEQEIQEIPRALVTKSEVLSRLKKSFIEKNEQYEATRQRIKTLQEKMLEAEQNREKLESQMDLIKTQREYEALDKEIRDAAEKELQFRRDLQKEEKVLEEMAHVLEREESLIKEQEEELQREQEKIRTEIESRKAQLASLEEQEKELIPGLDPEMLFKFERIIRSKSGLGIVPLKRGVCSGCHMILPIQFVNEVRSGQSILFCPYCSRILFYEEEGEDVYLVETSEEPIFEIDDFEAEDEEEFEEESGEEEYEREELEGELEEEDEEVEDEEEEELEEDEVEETEEEI
ncbi:MAG TPA: C4-type zinc ribbon domain-containing protein [Spirochaetales bacterium]|nr:nucleic acid-binding protein [Spirochaetales bacterium]HOV37883.1 C4-type zinc ribbon domain-containing protein [Spirochaetales bacterium]